jgi:small conductance mechanosensitive channel
MSYDFTALWQKAHALFDGFLALLPNLLLGGLVFTAFVFMGRSAHNAGVKLARRVRKHGNLGLILGNLFRWICLLLGLLIALSIIIPSFQARNLIELLGIGTVAVGFAFRDILQNFFAGILILITEPFEIGDEIIVDKFEGTVQTIETRATTIRSLDGKVIVIPNTTLFTQAVTVTKQGAHLRSFVEFTVDRQDDLAAVHDAAIAAARGVEGVLPEPAPDVVATALEDGAATLRLRWWTGPGRLAIQSKVIHAVQRILPGLSPKPGEGQRE